MGRANTKGERGKICDPDSDLVTEKVGVKLAFSFEKCPFYILNSCLVSKTNKITEVAQLYPKREKKVYRQIGNKPMAQRVRVLPARFGTIAAQPKSWCLPQQGPNNH